jgi:hypothetical protein
MLAFFQTLFNALHTIARRTQTSIAPLPWLLLRIGFRHRARIGSLYVASGHTSQL